MSTTLTPPSEPSGAPGAEPTQATYEVAEISQWRLMARRFRQSKIAVAGGFILVFMYLVAVFAHFLSPNEYDALDSNLKNASPSSLTWSGGLAVCGLTQELNRETVTYEYVKDCDNAHKVQWFGQGYEYKLLGVIPTSRHLMTVDQSGVGEEEPAAKLYLWGADPQGRDIFSRTMHGSRVSLTVGLIGVAISTILAAVIGTVSGYFGGVTDSVVQRFVEVILSIPTLPLWATLAAVIPRNLPVVERYFYITLILSLVVWANVARQIRGKVMSYAGSDYVAAARAAGSGHTRIILTHMMPNSMSHIVVVAMLAVPLTIIAETSLSFLGIGMLPPAVSWGVLLQDAQKVEVVTAHPWMLIPAVAVVIAVTCYQLLGDGIRDAVDPYG